MLRWIHKYLIILLLFVFSFSVYPNVPSAEVKYNSKQQAFLNFEEKVNKMVTASMEQLNKLDGKIDKKMDKESLYYIVLSTKQTFAESSKGFAKLEIPNIHSENIKTSLIQIKGDFSFGFKALEESMNYYAQYLDNQSPVLYWKSIKQRDIGITHINGGFTSLTTVKMQLILPEYREIPRNTWEVGKRYLYKLQGR